MAKLDASDAAGPDAFVLGTEEIGGDAPRASRDDLYRLFEHLEGELDESGFLLPAHKRPTMVRNLRNIFHRAQLTEPEVRTLRGVVSDLSRQRRRRQRGGESGPEEDA